MRLATNGLQFDGGSGRAAFMDDLMVCERTIAAMDRSVELLYRILTTVGLSLAEAKTYHMGLEWQETPGRTKHELRMHGDWNLQYLGSGVHTGSTEAQMRSPASRWTSGCESLASGWTASATGASRSRKFGRDWMEC